ncbi:MAG: fimbrial biogenesis chaperone [Parasphingopyxis sp.]|uniref:fimbrial biogenesis chaperone n=1 Tax=Parasphingopyxis sp. TaxID=1920299 RepID=UPI003FA16076
MILKYLPKRARSGCAAIALAAATLGAPAPVQANDLLVAPTRVVLNGSRGTEVILNNIGDEEATYRISLELRRMTADGGLEEVEIPDESEEAALGMIRYAPRRVVLPPNQPQAIRIGVRAPEDIPDGEYRVHMLFRAIPRPRPAAAEAESAGEGFQIRLIPVYGVTIPIIVRHGNLTATAAIANPRIVEENGVQAVGFDLSRVGDRSVYGEVTVTRPGVDVPLARARGVAVYAEIGSRSVVIPVSEEFQGNLAGPVRIQYREPDSSGGALITETEAVLR